MKAAHPTIAYRPDIDGLRGIAVLAVVFYHLAIGPFSGGFVGVDIFFVISGYLIAGIIQHEIEQGHFTFAAFYERRVRRLAPALFAVMVATLAVGIWLLLPTDLILLGKSMLATLVFGSNFFFWRHSGYFDSSAEFNPLLHMWSLAVEEQFYIGLPILLLLVHRFARAHLCWILIFCALLSFASCLIVQPSWPTATFYLSPFRAWELLVGVLLAVGALPKIAIDWLREVLCWIALGGLLISLVWIRADDTFPGWRAVTPVLTTGMLLHAGDGAGSSVHRLLRLRPLVFIGLLSYSLYLWHWPLLVYARYENAPALSSSGRWIILIIALALAWVSYRWIERPFRRNKRSRVNSRAQVFGIASVAACVPLILALVTILDHGLRFRVSSEVAEIDAQRVAPIPYENCDSQVPESGLCRVGDPTTIPSMLVWGDSFAMAWAPAFDTVLRSRGEAAYISVKSACPPLFGVRNSGHSLGCHNYSEQLYEWIKAQRPAAIFMIASWPSYSVPDGQYTLQDDAGHVGNRVVFTEAFDRTMHMIVPVTTKLIVIGPTPGAPSDVLLHLGMGLRGFSEMPMPKSVLEATQNSSYFWQVADRFRGTHGVVLIDPAPWFCDQLSCRYLTGTHVSLYRDVGHLNQAGASFVAPKLAVVMQQELHEPK